MIGYSESNGAKAVDQRVVGRFVSDTAGTFQSPVVIATGAGEYDDFSNTNPERWGDYSAIVVDPDDETFWSPTRSLKPPRQPLAATRTGVRGLPDWERSIRRPR